MDCPACRVPIPAEEIRPLRLIARCPACESTLELELVDGTLKIASFTEAATPEGVRVDVDRPSIRQEATSYRGSPTMQPGEFRASWRWPQTGLGALTLFVAICSALFISFFMEGNAVGDPLLSFFVLLLFVLVVPRLVWGLLATGLNRTTVEVEAGRLRSHDAPIPSPSDRTKPVALDDVSMFVVDCKTEHGVWRVDARMKTGESVPVVTHLEREEVARFLQRRLERQLDSPAPSMARVRAERVDAQEPREEQVREPTSSKQEREA